INVTLRLVKEESVPELVVDVPAGFLEEKIGQEEVDGEIFRAKAFQITVTGDKATLLLEKRIGDYVDGAPFGFSGKKLLITGGSDNTGFPMIKTLPGGGKKKLLLSSPPGYHPQGKGVRRRKFVRGNMITDEIVQINTKLVSEAQ
ncbi:MAG: 30S ribosomal protein S6e, partial [Desulfurococcales archaeon]|nr:30S ribosomal protein S6e [Desulfurococcales archaeon]